MGPSLTESYQLLLSNRELINSTWQFFISVHLALFAVSLFSTAKTQGRQLQLLLLLPFYVAFMYLNYHAQSDSYGYSARLIEYIQQLLQNAERENGEAVFDPGLRSWVSPYVAWIYTATGLASSAIIVFFAIKKNRSET